VSAARRRSGSAAPAASNAAHRSSRGASRCGERKREPPPPGELPGLVTSAARVAFHAYGNKRTRSKRRSPLRRSLDSATNSWSGGALAGPSGVLPGRRQRHDAVGGGVSQGAFWVDDAAGRVWAEPSAGCGPGGRPDCGPGGRPIGTPLEHIAGALRTSTDLVVWRDSGICKCASSRRGSAGLRNDLGHEHGLAACRRDRSALSLHRRMWRRPRVREPEIEDRRRGPARFVRVPR
jgi:hypothetical protein